MEESKHRYETDANTLHKNKGNWCSGCGEWTHQYIIRCHNCGTKNEN